MMKTGKWTALLTAAVLMVGCLTSCGGQKPDETQVVTETNLVQGAQIDTNSSRGEFGGGADTYYTIRFAQPTAVNTITLREKTRDDEGTVLGFTIEAEQNGNFETIYEQDKVGAFRYCAFDTVTADALRITVTDVRDGETFKIKEVCAYNVESSNARDFRVTSYIVASNVYDAANLTPESFDAITDVIFFGLTSFDENGNVFFNDIETEDGTVDGKTGFETALKNVRDAIGDRDVKIYCNFLGPDAKTATDDWNAQMYEKGDLHMSAMKDNQDQLISGIMDIVNTYDFDGVYFDYEYPLKTEHWDMYSDFLVALDGRLGDRLLGIALADWSIGLNEAAIAAVDRFEVMSYDLFDADGNHSPFYDCTVNSLESFEAKGINKEKLDLGLPFYARPADGGAFWYNWSSEAEQLGKYGNRATGKASDPADPCDTRWYNGWQMIYDKTAYAMDAGMGGIMMWHYNCDLPYTDDLSLLRAVNTAVEARA